MSIVFVAHSVRPTPESRQSSCVGNVRYPASSIPLPSSVSPLDGLPTGNLSRPKKRKTTGSLMRSGPDCNHKSPSPSGEVGEAAKKKPKPATLHRDSALSSFTPVNTSRRDSVTSSFTPVNQTALATKKSLFTRVTPSPPDQTPLAGKMSLFSPVPSKTAVASKKKPQRLACRGNKREAAVRVRERKHHSPVASEDRAIRADELYIDPLAYVA